jgi:predicted nucleic acid-binding protein
MRKVLFDTDILSEYLKARDESVVRSCAAYLRLHRYFTFTSITVYEITYGLRIKNADRQLERATAWLDRNEELAPTPADFRWAAAIKGAPRNRGLIVELPDCLIAAVAVRLDLPLVTGNTADYESIRKAGATLELQNWRSA